MAKLTPARRAALELAINGLAPRAPKGDDYGQAGNWLVDQGLVTRNARRHGWLFLTDAGADLCRSEGIALPDEGNPTVATVTAPSTTATFAVLPIDQLVPSPGNLRRDLGDLDGLAASIKADGILQALLVTPDFPDPDRWIVLAGHRRLAAAKLAGLTKVPCMIREAVPEDGRVATFLVENLRREGLAALEEAEGYRQLVALGWSQRKIAEHVGCKQPHVSKRLALLELPAEVRARVDLPESDNAHVTLEEAALLLKLKDDTAALTKAAKEFNIRRAVDGVLAERAYREGIEAMVAAAKAKGQRVLYAPKHGEKSKIPFVRVGNYDELDFGKKNAAHEGEPCHVAVVPQPGWGWALPPALARGCTDRKRHSKGGESKLKVPGGDTKRSPVDAKRLHEEKLRREATAARTAALQQVLAGEFDQADATAIILARFIDVSWASTRKLADRLLDFEIPGRGEVLERVDLLRLAYAVALAGWEEYARGQYGKGTPDELLKVLAAVGYQPGEWERKRMVEQVEDEADEMPAGDAAGIVECRECGCTSGDCGDGCSRVEADLCSACADNSVAAAAG